MTSTIERIATNQPARHFGPQRGPRVAKVTKVPAVPTSTECGLVAYARDVALALCRALSGRGWVVEARAPYLPSATADQRTEIAVAVDQRWLIVITQAQGGRVERDRGLTITINGRPIPHSCYAGQLSHDPAVIAGSVWRHQRGISEDPNPVTNR